MQIDCIYSGPDGRSRIAQVRLPVIEKVVDAEGRASYTGVQGGEGWSISVGAGSGRAGDQVGDFGEWHPVAYPLLSIVLAGEWEVEAGDGTRRVLGLGSIIAFIDDRGQGHRSRVTSPEQGCTAMGVRLDAASLADLKIQIG